MANQQSQIPNLKSKIFLYGPPGSGKSTLGRQMAEALKLPFFDLDERIQSRVGKSIPEIFAQHGEAGFRRLEKDEVSSILEQEWGIIALGGGALLDAENREQVSSAGPILCLTAPFEMLLARLEASSEARPLLADEVQDGIAARLMRLLAGRAEHYQSFALQLDTSTESPRDLAWEAQVKLGAFHVSGMGNPAHGDPSDPRSQGYDVSVQRRSLEGLGEAMCQRALQGPIALVSDENVAGLHLHKPLRSLQEAGFAVQPIVVPSGEGSKDISTLTFLWEAFVELGLERGSTVIALGGGVVGDLAGFAAATYKRGVPWVAVPTTLLAMVDASLGGKTAIDLLKGKNLVGAFHAPRIVLNDPLTLLTLPAEELRAGMAEVVKASIIGDPSLFNLCAQGWEEVQANLDPIVRRSIAVKIKVIEADPFERGERAALNLGHTIGHAVELVSEFGLKHGEAIAIGMVAEARLAEVIGLTEKGLAEQVEGVLHSLGLPTRIPENLDKHAIREAIYRDKKLAGGKVHFALPAKIGTVKVGVVIEEATWSQL